MVQMRREREIDISYIYLIRFARPPHPSFRQRKTNRGKGRQQEATGDEGRPSLNTLLHACQCQLLINNLKFKLGLFAPSSKCGSRIFFSYCQPRHVNADLPLQVPRTYLPRPSQNDSMLANPSRNRSRCYCYYCCFYCCCCCRGRCCKGDDTITHAMYPG